MTKANLGALAIGAVSTLAAAWSGAAAGADFSSTAVAPSELVEIVVTAQKRSERLQDIPLSVSAVTEQSLKNQGITQFTDLVSRVDILAENFGPGVVDRFGFTWERLHELNPRLIYASIKGFGPGKYFNFKAYEVIAQAMGGSMATTGFEHGPPTATGAQIGDSGTGIHLVTGILDGIVEKIGQYLVDGLGIAKHLGALGLYRF